MKTLYIVRGLPGAGKSSLAKVLAPENNFAADDFFTINGKYNWTPSGVADAHASCQAKTEDAMKRGVIRIAVANTFTTNAEMSVYFEFAKKYDYIVQVVHAEGAVKFAGSVWTRFTNIHSVPETIIEKMYQRWQSF